MPSRTRSARPASPGGRASQPASMQEAFEPGAGERRIALDAAVAEASRALDLRPADAKVKAQDILAGTPDHAHAMLVLASAMRRLGDAKGAAKLLHRLVDARPSVAGGHYELGVALLQLGERPRALAALRKAASLKPDMVEAWQALGDPALATAAAALRSGRLDAVEATLDTRLKAQPTDLGATRMLADVHSRRGRHPLAEDALQRCLQLAPNFPGLRQALAAVLITRQNGAGALTQIERLLRDEPDNPHFRNLKAVALGLVGEEGQAITAYERVLAARPDLSKIWLSYGHALKTVGRREDSVAAYRRAIALVPTLGQAYWSLANLKLVKLGQNDLGAMRAALDRPQTGDDDRLHLHYALAKALEDAGRFEDAFGHYQRGARLRRQRAPYDAAATSTQVARAKAVFTRTLFERRQGQGCDAPDPIFVVGLPRSGSTLVEQILSTHPAVEGTRELVDIAAIVRHLDPYGDRARPKAYPEVLDTLDADALSALGRGYIASTRVQRKTDRPVFIDKTPGNFLHIGMIHLILPKAKIIDVRRHPLATCVSGFRQHFAHDYDFSYDLEDLGLYYRDYLELMAHFDAVLPGRVHRIVHEDLVRDTEAEVHRLLDYCGLPFEPKCLRFYENDRAVRTPSSEQVRRPISNEGADQWRNFDPWLDPLKAALGPALDEYR